MVGKTGGVSQDRMKSGRVRKGFQRDSRETGDCRSGYGERRRRRIV